MGKELGMECLLLFDRQEVRKKKLASLTVPTMFVLIEGLAKLSR
jgi:hypothetical protein